MADLHFLGQTQKTEVALQHSVNIYATEIEISYAEGSQYVINIHFSISN